MNKILLVPHTCGEVHLIEVAEDKECDLWRKRAKHVQGVLCKAEQNRCGSCWEIGTPEDLILVGQAGTGLMIVHEEECLQNVYEEDWRVIGVMLEPPYPEIDEEEEEDADAD